MKRLFVLFTVMCMAAPLFALPDFTLSAGGGGIFNVHWKDAVLRSQYKDYTGAKFVGGRVEAPTEPTQDAMRQGLFDTKDLTVGGGIYGFFDATFAEAGIALVWNRVSQTVAIPNLPGVSSSMHGSETHDYLFTQLNLSLLFKYPFTLGEKWTLFPLLGIDGQIALGDYDEQMRKDFKKVKSYGYDMPNLGEFWNSLWIRAGVGADFAMTNNLYLRGETLYGMKLNSAYETKMADYWAEDIKGVANGINVRLGVGYKFKTFTGK
ncbi:hypothetical protein AGMMS50293_05450 [Spirochaetia bacterium]|nr:hypothetical protein AGMMS50293_05450 [Spirochaetia bacterium]